MARRSNYNCKYPFSASLVPQVYYGFKEKVGPIKFQTSVPTFIGLFAMSAAFWSMGLFYSGAMSACGGLMWLMLFAQRIAYSKP
ncbi:MAG: hypothetical protein WCO55_02680 [Candidatus Falkowbacteria bacterium]